MSLKTFIGKFKTEHPEKPSIYYVEHKKLSSKDYSSLFVEIENLESLFKKVSEITGKFVYVGLCTQQNISLLTLIVACLQNERPFVYIDIENQPESNCRLIENLHITSILLDEQSEQLKDIMKAPYLVETFSLWGENIGLWVTGETPSQKLSEPVMMYAVQTSGSTGKRKIVQVPEQAIMPNIIDLRSRWSVTSDDVVLLASPPTFDPYMVELLLAVTSGAAVLLVGPELRTSPCHLLDTVFPLVTVAQLTPSVFTRWSVQQIRTRVLAKDSQLRILALGGEKYPPVSWWQQCRADGNKTQLYNLYGATEVSCWALVAPGTDDTLGSPLSETQLRVVDRTGRTVTDGTGEMYIGSATRMCLVDDETWEQLQPPVFRATGDLVSVKNNTYKYLERKDNVVKRWGHRVSLDCVESVAAEHADVTAACCVLHADVLALYVCLCPGSNAVDTVKADLRQALQKQLNKASVPDVILTLDSLPLNSHGCYDGCVYCICLASGRTLWSYRTGAMVKGTATAVVDTWIVGSYDYHVYCLDTQAGKLKWKQKMDGIVLATPLPVSQQGLVVVATLAGGVAALVGNTGAVSWSMSLPSPIFSSPCLVDEVVVVAEVDGTIHGLQVHSGSRVWQYRVGGKVFSSLVALDDSVMFGCHDDSVHRLRCPPSPQGPALVWSCPAGSAVYATPARLSPRHVVVASTAGQVSALDVTSGAALCSTRLPGEVFSSPVSCGNFVIVGCRDDNVYCLEVINKVC